MDQTRLSHLVNKAKFGAEHFARDLAKKDIRPEHMLEMYNGLIGIVGNLTKDVERLQTSVTSLETQIQSLQQQPKTGR